MNRALLLENLPDLLEELDARLTALEAEIERQQALIAALRQNSADLMQAIQDQQSAA